MDNSILTTDNCGYPHKITAAELFNDCDFEDRMLEVLRLEASNPNSRFIQILRTAMETIADDEIEKVLKK